MLIIFLRSNHPTSGNDSTFCKMIIYTERTFSLFILAKDWKQFKCPSTEDGINKSHYSDRNSKSISKM